MTTHYDDMTFAQRLALAHEYNHPLSNPSVKSHFWLRFGPELLNAYEMATGGVPDCPLCFRAYKVAEDRVCHYCEESV